MKVKNEGHIGQAIRVPGGSVTVKPGKTVMIKNLKLTDEQIAHFEERGLVFPDTLERKAKVDKQAETAKVAIAEKAHNDAIAASKANLSAAQKLLSEATSNADKQAASKIVDDAKAALAVLTEPGK